MTRDDVLFPDRVSDLLRQVFNIARQINDGSRGKARRPDHVSLEISRRCEDFGSLWLPCRTANQHSLYRTAAVFICVEQIRPTVAAKTHIGQYLNTVNAKAALINAADMHSRHSRGIGLGRQLFGMAHRRIIPVPAHRQTFKKMSWQQRLEQRLALAGIFSNVVSGLGTIVLAVVGLGLTRDFNQWQKHALITQRTLEEKRSQESQLEQHKDRCIAIAGIGVQMARGKSEREAINSLKAAELFDPQCVNIGVNVTKLTADKVIADADDFPRPIVILAAAIKAAVGSYHNPEANNRSLTRGRGLSSKIGASHDGEVVQFRYHSLSRSLKGEREPVASDVSPTTAYPSNDLRKAMAKRFERGANTGEYGHEKSEAHADLTVERVVSWNSPFGPIRVRIAENILRGVGGDTTPGNTMQGTTF